MIRLEDVTKRYGGTLAVDSLTFEVPEGEVTYRVPELGPGGVCLKQAISDKITADKQRVISYPQDLQEFQNWKGSQPKATA